MASEPSLEQVSDNLIAYLRSEINDPDVDYDAQLTRILGGYDTFIYHFRLKGVQKELADRLVLRLFRESNNPDKAIREGVVQNVLAEQGYPAPSVFFTCTNKSLLGGAFLIMEFLPGKTMLGAAMENPGTVLGTIHAKLHSIDPEPIAKALRDQGFEEPSYRISGRYFWLNEMRFRFPWLQETAQWLVDNRPKESDNPSICHGDFHPLNILVDRGKVSGILDWPGFVIADPIMDVANTIFIMEIPARHLLPDLRAEEFIPRYLSGYRDVRTLDLQNLDYYRVLRCVAALVEGKEGQEIWNIPAMAKDLIDLIRDVTGIRIRPGG